jgi:ABC-type transport system involved in multi-copper enzyme maturation permease subunit
MLHITATIARYTLLEALHTRLIALVACGIAILLAASLFAQELAIAEGTRFQIGIYAAGMRIAAVVFAGLYVLASMAREFDDKGLEFMLALDLPRAQYLLGKLAGYLAIGGLVAAAATAPVALAAPAQAALQWGISLAAELAVVAAFALFCIVSLGHLTLAASVLLGFYLLGRVLTAVRLMGMNPISGGDSLGQQMLHWMAEGLALVMPAFDGWTRTTWLVDAPAPWSDIAVLGGQGMLYVTLLAAASMFDFYRREL